MTKHPERLGTVWDVNATVQVIDEQTMRWKTVGRCGDTPKGVAECLALLRAIPTLKGATFWLHHEWGERECLGK